jgi:ABC-2 type transport system permease protein
VNIQAIQILFLKDLFLSRRHLFAYFAAGIVSSILICLPDPTWTFIGFLLIMTVAIAAGIHLIGQLLLAETTENTRLFVMSLPVSLLEYSIAKISVVLTTYLIPWSAMFACCVMGAFLLPWSARGSVVVLPALFLFLLAGFTLQLVTAVVTESVGWTICMMVAGNVLLNVFLAKMFALPEIIAAKQSQLVVWPRVILLTIALECAVIFVALVAAFLLQTRKRDLV